MLLTLTVKSSCIWDNLNLFPMNMYLVFLTLRVNLFAFSHGWIKFISQFILYSRTYVSSADEVRVVSSAYTLGFKNKLQEGRSLI